jgi:hypothetical protein
MFFGAYTFMVRFVPFTLMLSAKEKVVRLANTARERTHCAFLKILPNIPLTPWDTRPNCITIRYIRDGFKLSARLYFSLRFVKGGWTRRRCPLGGGHDNIRGVF